MKLDEVAEEEEVHLHHLHEAHHQVLILRATQLQHHQQQQAHTQRAIQLQQLPQHQLAHTQKAMEHQHQLQRLVTLPHLHTASLIQATLLQHDKPLHIQQLLIIGQLSTLTE